MLNLCARGRQNGRIVSGLRSTGLVHVWLLDLCMVVACTLAGCAQDSRSGDQADDKPALTYRGLAGQTCAVVVWADSLTRTEFNQVQVDLARALQGRLTEAAERRPAGKDQSARVRFLDPRSVVRFQRENPDTESQPITEYAPRLGVTRVVYIELEELQTQSPRSILLLKGQATATLRVVEVAGGSSRIAFEERGIRVQYPPNAPEGVVPTDKVNERTIYEGTLLALAGRLAARLPI